MPQMISAPKMKSIAPQHPELDKPSAISRKAKSKTALRQVVVVAEANQDLAWMGRLKSMFFEPQLMFSNFDAVQRMTDDLELKMVLFAQHSPMMDGITACQLLRQSRSEDDVAIVLLLDDNLDESISEAFAAGASDVVCQPYYAAELVARLDATRQRLQLWDDVESKDLFTPSAESSDIGSDSSSEFVVDAVRVRQEVPEAIYSDASGVVEDDANFELQSDTPHAHMRSHIGGMQPSQCLKEVPPPVVPAPALELPPVQQPATPPALTLLLGDWLLTHDLPHGIKPPALDLFQLKFVPTIPVPQADAARQRGALSERLLDRVWVCPQCRALPSFRPACPCCGSAGVERDQMLHHFACAFVGPTSDFQVSDEGLACPKCCAQRLMVGTDCEFLDGPWRCTDCDWNTNELEIVGHCLKCGFRFPAHQAAIEDLMGQHVC